jgi:prepilin-type N-terminal cleavage/methylation domain-containing protein
MYSSHKGFKNGTLDASLRWHDKQKALDASLRWHDYNWFNNRGFTLIELMIVIAIISILATLAIPSYQSYTRRARFSEVVTMADAFKTSVSLALQEGAPIAEINNGTFGIPESPTPTKNLASIVVNNGVITATGSTLTEDATLIMTPSEDGSRWAISGSCLDKGFCHA